MGRQEQKERKILNIEAARYFNEYFDLTGRNFPPCNREDWDSLNDWFVDLKVAVYRERAICAVYGNRKDAPVQEAPADGRKRVG